MDMEMIGMVETLDGFWLVWGTESASAPLYTRLEYECSMDVLYCSMYGEWLVVIEVLEVNGLSVDIAARHIYWTDAQRQRIEMSDYDGENRRVVIHVNLHAPRAIVVDADNG